MSEIALVGPFNNEQQQIVETGLSNYGHNANVQIHPSIETVPQGALVAVRGGVKIPAERSDLKVVISGGRGTENIESTEDRQILDCRGENAPETAAHGFGLMLTALEQVYSGQTLTSDLNLAVVGPGSVGVSAAILGNELGFNTKLVQREGKPIPVDLEQQVSNDLSDSLNAADVIILAANGNEVIGEAQLASLIQLKERPKILVNIARANSVNKAVFDKLRASGNIVITSDVWYNEPKAGEELPLDLVRTVLGSDNRNAIAGTMHQAAQQASSNLAVAHKLTSVLNHILAGEPVPDHADPLDIYRAAMLRIIPQETTIAALLETSDVRRVAKLKLQLLTLAGQAAAGETPKWTNPGIIMPEVGKSHQLVSLIRSAINRNVD